MREHTVQPGMVYVSFPTEMGTLYTKEELTDLSNACHECGIPLYIDGARLGYGLTSPKNDVTLQDIVNLCDMFYIGGTKCGALMGEALVILNDKLKDGFRYIIKQHGGLLAKGRLLGLQFETLFTDNLYFDICKHAVEQAMQIRRAFEAKGVEMYTDSYTNQQFVIIEDHQMEKLAENFAFETWEKYDADPPSSASAPAGQPRMKMYRHWLTPLQRCKSNRQKARGNPCFFGIRRRLGLAVGGNLVKNTERAGFSTENFLGKCKAKHLDRMGKLRYNSKGKFSKGFCLYTNIRPKPKRGAARWPKTWKYRFCSTTTVRC